MIKFHIFIIIIIFKFINGFLKIGIKSIYDLSNFTDKLTIEKIEAADKFFYLYFKNIIDYEEIIKIIVLNLK